MLVRTVHVVLLAGPTSSIAETDIPLLTGRRELTNMAVTGGRDRLDGKGTRITGG